MICSEETIRLVPDLGECDLGKVESSLLTLSEMFSQAAAEVSAIGEELSKARPGLARP